MVDTPALNSSATAFDKNLPNNISELTLLPRKIWWAGLGLYSRAEEKGQSLFEELIDAGKDYQDRNFVEKKMVLPEVNTIKLTLWDRVEATLNHQVATLLHRLGLSSRDEVDNLRLKIDQLNDKLSLIRQKINAKKTAAKKTTSTKTKAKSTKTAK